MLKKRKINLKINAEKLREIIRDIYTKKNRVYYPSDNETFIKSRILKY